MHIGRNLSAANFSFENANECTNFHSSKLEMEQQRGYQAEEDENDDEVDISIKDFIYVKISTFFATNRRHF